MQSQILVSNSNLISSNIYTHNIQQSAPIFFQLARFRYLFKQVNQQITLILILNTNSRNMPKQESSFIQKLHGAIQQYRPTIVDWDPQGKGFVVANLHEFTNLILLRKFGIGRLDSFARKLNRHGFKRSKIDKNKIRFSHKFFTKQSKNLNKIRKLTKMESLPKHIKLRMIRQQRQQQNKNRTSLPRQADIVTQIFQNTKLKENQSKKIQGYLSIGHSLNNNYLFPNIIQNKFEQYVDYKQGNFLDENQSCQINDQLNDFNYHHQFYTGKFDQNQEYNQSSQQQQNKKSNTNSNQEYSQLYINSYYPDKNRNFDFGNKDIILKNQQRENMPNRHKSKYSETSDYHESKAHSKKQLRDARYERRNRN